MKRRYLSPAFWPLFLEYGTAFRLVPPDRVRMPYGPERA